MAMRNPRRPDPEEQSPRADGEDHQNLSGHRFHEPAGPEQRRACPEQRQQSVEGEKIEGRTDRPEDQHEALDELDVPFDWQTEGRLSRT
jgi:hypothetical protein